ncbi:PASTA domain-containing protein [Streptomyces sp. NPDC048419]|uniref:PASTA domain-containing protein n=1 Tax=Streptomyces sp. NPDC048419 TaxID=3365547 RepID=UPI00371A5D87
MIDVQGMMQLEAEEKLRTEGIAVSAILPQESLDAKGKVLHATPEPGTVLGVTGEQTVEVQLLISTGVDRKDFQKVGELALESLTGEAGGWLRSFVGLKPKAPTMPSAKAATPLPSLLPSTGEEEEEDLPARVSRPPARTAPSVPRLPLYAPRARPTPRAAAPAPGIPRYERLMSAAARAELALEEQASAAAAARGTEARAAEPTPQGRAAAAAATSMRPPAAAAPATEQEQRPEQGAVSIQSLKEDDLVWLAERLYPALQQKLSDELKVNRARFGLSSDF